MPYRLRELILEKLNISNNGILESAIHACTQITLLELNDVACEQLCLKDLFYLKTAHFDVGPFHHVVSLFNCPNLEFLKARNLLKIAPPCNQSPINKLRELHYEIPQNQERYLNNEESELDMARLRELFRTEVEFLTHFDLSTYKQQASKPTTNPPGALLKMFIKPFYGHDYCLLPNLQECSIYNIADQLSINKNQTLKSLIVHRCS